MSRELILVVAAYLLGSVPTGLLLARMMGGIDIRSTGSGNIGATNVSRTLGWKVGVMTLAGDCLKGVIPVLLARQLGFTEGWLALTGLAAFSGHVYTVFLKFKGGKGVATALGVFIAISPVSLLCAFALFALILWKWRYVSLASIAAASAMPIIIALIDRRGLIFLTSIVIASIVVWKHRENIIRLKEGTESKFKG